MKNYYFDADGLYTGSATANAGTLPPVNALRADPPQKTGFWPVLAPGGDAWELLEDHRGRTGWLRGRRCEITTPGPLPEGWSEEAPAAFDAGDTDAKRRSDYVREADPLRDAALSFLAEAEAWRLSGNAERAEQAEAKGQRVLREYLEKKEEIRSHHPTPDGCTEDERREGAATPGGENPSRYYLTRSGLYHAIGCPHTRAAGEGLDIAEIRAHRPEARPCRRCVTSSDAG